MLDSLVVQQYCALEESVCFFLYADDYVNDYTRAAMPAKAGIQLLGLKALAPRVARHPCAHLPPEIPSKKDASSIQAQLSFAELTDTSIAEAHESKRLADEAESQVAPIHALLDFWRTLRWLVTWRSSSACRTAGSSPAKRANMRSL